MTAPANRASPRLGATDVEPAINLHVEGQPTGPELQQPVASLDPVFDSNQSNFGYLFDRAKEITIAE
jgi:hypothetical protein